MQRSTSGSSRSRFALTHRDRVLLQEVLYPSGEPDVPLRHATLAMCLDREPDGGVSDVYVGMMLFFFGYLSHVIDEPDSGHESLEIEGLGDEVSIELPAVEFLQFRLNLCLG